MSNIDKTKIVRVHESRILDYLGDVLEPHEIFSFINDSVAGRESIRMWLQNKSYEEINGERHYILYAPKKVAKIEVRAAWKEPTDYLQKEVM